MAVTATAIWRVRPSGSNTNGGGYDPGIAGAGTDYSQQDAAQATGTHGVTTGTTTFTDATAAAFTSAMIGNAIWISGTGQTTGAYFVTAFTSASVVTLDRTPGTGTAATWHLGGGWVDFWTNTTANPPLTPGNIVYILGSGTPNPASYTFDYTMTTAFTPLTGNQTAGAIVFANDPGTPGYKAAPDTTGGMPCVNLNGGNIKPKNHLFKGIYFVLSAAPGDGSNAVYSPQNASFSFKSVGCVFDQLGHDTYVYVNATTSESFSFIYFLGCEIFTSNTTPLTSTGTAAIYAAFGTVFIIGCNIHDYPCATTGAAIGIAQGLIEDTIISKCKGAGIFVFDWSSAGNTSASSVQIKNNTIDGNGNSGIQYASATALATTFVLNNLITNHAAAATYGIDASLAGSLAANDRIKLASILDFNYFYNNTTDLNGISYGPHDFSNVNPYFGQTLENYTLS